MIQIDRHELGPKAKSYDCDTDSAVISHMVALNCGLTLRMNRAGEAARGLGGVAFDPIAGSPCSYLRVTDLSMSCKDDWS